MLTPFWLRKCSSLSLLPRTPSAFQQARSGPLHRVVLLGRAAIFGQVENNGLQDRPRAGCPCGKGGNGREEPTSQLHTCLDGEAIEIRNVLEWGSGILGGDHQVRGCLAAVLTLAAAVFFGFPASGLVAVVDLVLGFLGPVFFLVAVTSGCLGASLTG
jgi:hypothetical protein